MRLMFFRGTILYNYISTWTNEFTTNGRVGGKNQPHIWIKAEFEVSTPPASNSSVARLIPLSVIKFYDKLSQRVTWEYYGRVRYVTGARRSSLDPKRVSSCCSARTNRVSFQRTKLSFRTSPTKRYRRLLYTCAEHSTGRHGLLGVHILYSPPTPMPPHWVTIIILI